MNWTDVPWVELTIALPLAGAAAVRLARDPAAAARLCLAFSVASLAASAVPWAVQATGADAPDLVGRWAGSRVFAVDRLSAPLLPLVALLHVLTVLATARVKLNRMSLTGHLIAESIRLATFACLDPWPLIGLLALGAVPPYLELIGRGKPTRVFVVHMAVFVGLLAGGWAGAEAGAGWAPAALLAAVLVRSGTVPAHLWVADLFEHASFGTALLFVAPLAGVYAALRLILPVAPEWVLEAIGVASLVTAVYAAGMAVVQREARRFFAYLLLSHGSLVLVGLELHTPISLTGALCLWASVVLSLGGLGLTLRAVEARFGRLPLDGYRGLYDQSPALAVCFLLTGLGSVGFPGTLGFVAGELLVDGAIEADLVVGVGLVLAGALNGIAVVRAYLLLFTGAKHASPVPLGITPRERFAVLTLAALVVGGGLFPQLSVGHQFETAGMILRERKEREDRPPGESPPPAEPVLVDEFDD